MKFRRAQQSRRGAGGILGDLGIFRSRGTKSQKTGPRAGAFKRRYSFILTFLKFITKRIGTIISLGFVVFLIVIIRLAVSTDYFDVKEIGVTGVEKTDRAKLEEVAKKYKDKNIYSVDLDKLEKEIAEISIYIKDVYAKKHLPNRIDISIKERYPSYVLLNYDGIYLIDEEFIVTNIPFTQEIGFTEQELDAYAKNDIESEVIWEKLFAKIKAGELEVELDDILNEGADKEDLQIEDIDFAKIDQQIKLEELIALKQEVDGIIANHFATLEQIANESEYAGLRRIYFSKNGNYKEGDKAEIARLGIFEKVSEYFAENEKYTIAKAIWTSDYTLRVDFVEGKMILFASNREIERQFEDLEIVLEELRTSGKDFSRIDLRTETIGVK